MIIIDIFKIKKRMKISLHSLLLSVLLGVPLQSICMELIQINEDSDEIVKSPNSLELLELIHDEQPLKKQHISTSPLCDAIRFDRAHEIETLLEQRGELSKADAGGILPIFHAVNKGLSCVQKIIECMQKEEIFTDECKNNVFLLACAKGDTNLVSYFCKNHPEVLSDKVTTSPDFLGQFNRNSFLDKQDIYVGPLDCAVLSGKKEAVNVLIKASPFLSVDQKTLQIAIEQNYIELLSFLIKEKRIPFLSIEFACRAYQKGCVEVVDFCLEKGHHLGQLIFAAVGKNDQETLRKIREHCKDYTEIDRALFDGAMGCGNVALAGEVLNQGRITLGEPLKYINNPKEVLEYTPLIHAIEKGDQGLFDFALERNAIIDVPVKVDQSCWGCEKIYPFTFAVLKHQFDMANRLCAMADFSPIALQTLEIASKRLDAPAVGFCCKCLSSSSPTQPPDAQKNQNNFFKASAQGDVAKVLELLPLGVSKNVQDPETKETPLSAAVARGHLDVLKLLLQMAEYTNYAVLEVLDNNKDAVIDLLVTHAVKSDTSKIQFLMYNAAKIGQRKCLERLLHEGVDSNLVLDSKNTSALTVASFHGHNECIELLLEKGAKDYETALIVAKTKEIAQKLASYMLEKGLVIKSLLEGKKLPREVDPNTQDSDGKTLLMKVLEKNALQVEMREKAVRLLLETKPNLALRDKNQRTALIYAVLTRNTNFVALLNKANTKVSDTMDALRLAAQNGLVEIVDGLTESLPPDAKSYAAKIAVSEALCFNQPKLAVHMVQKGVRLEQPLEYYKNGQRTLVMLPLNIASHVGSVDVVKALLNAGAPTYASTVTYSHAFMDALKAGHFQIAALVLRVKPPTEECLKSLRAENIYVQAQLKNGSADLLLGKELESKVSHKLDCVESLRLLTLLEDERLQKFLSDPQKYLDEFILYYAFFSVNPCHGAMSLLKESEKRQQVWSKYYEAFIQNARSQYKQTLLMWACIFGHKDIVEKLVTLGLPRKYINEKDCYGKTALMYALLYGNVDCALTLICHERVDVDGQKIVTNHCGKGINVADTFGRTALFYAVYGARMDHPLSLKIGNSVKESLIAYSQQAGAIRIIDVLCRAGAKIFPLKNFALACRILVEDGNWQVLVDLIWRINQCRVNSVKGQDSKAL